MKVSIPFKREGTCEREGIFWIGILTLFQFPSNGKVHVNFRATIYGTSH